MLAVDLIRIVDNLMCFVHGVGGILGTNVQHAWWVRWCWVGKTVTSHKQIYAGL